MPSLCGICAGHSIPGFALLKLSISIPRSPVRISALVAR